jgi:hypothetical protein
VSPGLPERRGTAEAFDLKISTWNPGSVMYDLNVDELVRQQR